MRWAVVLVVALVAGAGVSVAVGASGGSLTGTCGSPPCVFTLTVNTPTQKTVTVTSPPVTTTVTSTVTVTASSTTTTPPPPGPCATSTPNVPDGPDPFGGCFPGPATTGPLPGTTLTAYTGSCTITQPNIIIDSKIINCPNDLVVSSTAGGLLIQNSIVNGAVLQPDNSSAQFAIQNSRIDGHNTTTPGPYACVNCGVGYRNFTMVRVEVTGTNRGAYCEHVCNITDSWVHGTDLQVISTNHAHASGIRLEQFATLTHNSVACDFLGPFNNDTLGCSADLSGYPDFVPIHDNTVDSNLLESNNTGLGFCAYGGGTQGKPFSNDPANATNVRFTNNVFQAGLNGICGTYGPVTDFIIGRTGNVWSGNVFDNGTVVPPA